MGTEPFSTYNEWEVYPTHYGGIGIFLDDDGYYARTIRSREELNSFIAQLQKTADLVFSPTEVSNDTN